MDEVEQQLESLLRERLRKAEGTRLSRVLMANFPCTAGRVDWRKARDVLERPAPPARAHGANISSEGFQTSAYVAEVVSFFNECVLRHGIADEWVAFVGDSMDTEYEVALSAAPELLAIVAEVPDHKYIFALTGAWCLMWSFEDDLYFGLCP
jgi:hypothetical protein